MLVFVFCFDESLGPYAQNVRRMYYKLLGSTKPDGPFLGCWPCRIGFVGFGAIFGKRDEMPNVYN
jgi:hypothetical protein